jgi:type II secretory pathway pseudopilin PulG
MQEHGYTLPEMVITVALFMVMAAVGMAVLSPAITTAKTDSEIKRVIGLLQVARETAITRQRDVELRIDEDAGVLRLVRIDDGDEFPFLEVTLEGRVRFHRFDGMGNTPDGAAGDGAVEFGGSERLLFISDGSIVDESDLPVNGSMYLGIDGTPLSARAVTLTGTTARTRTYRWSNDEWVAQ